MLLNNSIEKKKILLVDDDKAFHDIVTFFLSEKYDIITSISGYEALHLILQNKIDLVLLDIIMPEMDGWETFHRIIN
jgi:CheY-like chemotaxis protein